MKRLTRFVEILGIFGLWDKHTWKTLFPPFRGWDVGCGYCALVGDALKSGRCDRARELRDGGKCGVTEKKSDGT